MTEQRIREITAELGMKPLGPPSAEGWLCYPCPFAPWLHARGADHNPSFFVHINNQGYSGFNCFTCKKRGRVSTLVRELHRHWGTHPQGLDIRADLFETPDEFTEYEELRNYQLREPQALNKNAYLGMYPLAWESPDGRRYLEARGISASTAYLLGLLYDPDEYRILFPVLDGKGDLFGFTGRSILEPHRYPYQKYPKVRDYAGLPKEHMILGEHMIENERPLWAVEGLFAFANMIEIGSRAIVNPIAPMGSRILPYQRDRIATYNRPVYLCFDLDQAGEDGLYGSRGAEGTPRKDDGAIYMLTGHVPVFIPPYPHGIDDPDHLRSLDDIKLMMEHAELVA